MKRNREETQPDQPDEEKNENPTPVERNEEEEKEPQQEQKEQLKNGEFGRVDVGNDDENEDGESETSDDEDKGRISRRKKRRKTESEQEEKEASESAVEDRTSAGNGGEEVAKETTEMATPKEELPHPSFSPSTAAAAATTTTTVAEATNTTAIITKEENVVPPQIGIGIPSSSSATLAPNAYYSSAQQPVQVQQQQPVQVQQQLYPGRNRPQPYQYDPVGTNLFVNFLPPFVNDMQLRQMFSPFGEIVSCRVMIDIPTKQSRGFGFVQFSSTEQASSALSAMNGHRIDNKILQVKFAQSNSAENLGTPNTNLYMKGIPHNVDKSQLQIAFSRFGKVEDCIIIIDYKTKESRGVGFCRFSTLEEAKRAIDACQGKMDVFPGQTEQLEIKYANEKSRRVSQRGMNMETTPMTGYYNAPMGQNASHMPFPVSPNVPHSHPNQFMEYMAAMQLYASMYGYTPEQMNMYMQGYQGSMQQPSQFGAWPGMMGAAAAAASTTPSSAQTGRDTIMVNNLPNDTNKSLIINMLKTYGHMKDIQVMPDAVGGGKCARVTFSNPANAVAALQGVHQTRRGERIVTANFI